MRYMAIDLGAKRTGIATGDSVTRIVTPAAVIETPIDRDRGDALLEAIAEQINHHFGAAADFELVLGLPLNMDGTEGTPAAQTRAFADRLEKKTGKPVHLQDERLSSAEADWSMARSGMTRNQKKQRRDALAAAAILREFLGNTA